LNTLGIPDITGFEHHPYLVLTPYFKKIDDSLLTLSTFDRQKSLAQYRRYIERYAQKTPHSAVRAQLRINLSMLFQKYDYYGVPVEQNVRSRNRMDNLLEETANRLTDTDVATMQILEDDEI
jgi:hypothetical protein